MNKVFVNNYREATTILTNRDFAQSLYDDSSIIMKDVILTSDAESQKNSRKQEFQLIIKKISSNLFYYLQYVFKSHIWLFREQKSPSKQCFLKQKSTRQ